MSIIDQFKHLKQSSRAPSFSSYEARVSRLRALQRLCVENEEAIFQALTEDLGKSRFESYLTEIAIVKDEIDHALKNLKKWMKPLSVSGPWAFFWSQNQRVPEPLGVALIIAPWNYPFQLLLAPLVGALAAGNAVVLKPSELSVSVSKLFGQLIPKYFSRDEVVVVEGAVEETTQLLSLPFDHIFFTGSTRVGKIVMEKASAHLTPVTLELGGKSPCLLFEKENFDLSVKRIMWGKFLNCGQTCVAPDYILLPKGQTVAFIKSAKKWLSAFYGEDVLRSQDYGKIINAQQFTRLESLVEKEKVLLSYGSDPKLLKLGPTFVQAQADDLVMEEEIFGPVLPILEMSSFEEAIDFVNSKDKPLAAYLFSGDQDQRDQFLQKVSSGGMCINDVVVHLGNKNLPFGGVGPSGLGAYHGKFSFEIFTHYKSVMRRSFLWENSLRYFPAMGKLNLLRRLLPWVS